MAGIVTAMLTIDPSLTPDEIRLLPRAASLSIGEDVDFEPADIVDLTAQILPSERAEQIDNPDVGRSSRLDTHRTLMLTVEGLTGE